MPHKHYDGVGALWELHRSRYGEDGAGPMPTLRQPDPPGFVDGWREFVRFMSRPRAPAAAWRCLDPSWRGRSPEASKAATPSFRVLTPEQTRAVAARAKAEGVSVNTLLLWALGRAVEPALDLERGAVRWMVPVNMRGAVWRRRATSNHSSYVWRLDNKALEELPASFSQCYNRRTWKAVCGDFSEPKPSLTFAKHAPSCEGCRTNLLFAWAQRKALSEGYRRLLPKAFPERSLEGFPP